MVLRVGVVGGGQLARMMIPAAVNLGIEIRVLAEAEGMSAALAATSVGDYRDQATVEAFAADVDVVTFDHEHVPQSVLRALVDAGVRVHPGPDALQFAQDKLRMRERLEALGMPQPEWAAVSDEAQLQAFIDAHAGRAVVKTPRGGYDGKGVRLVSSAAEAADWFAAIADDPAGSALLAEELVDFRRELAQLVARSPSGEVRHWPVVETVQKGGVCAEVFAPAPNATTRLVEVAGEIGDAIVSGLGVTGVMAVELFETVDERLLVNELAMRPHNSGHWTQDGAVTSQFEQHLRAVLDLPLGDPRPVAPWTVMANVLGGDYPQVYPAYRHVMARDPGAKVHMYGKGVRPGRKIGHVTVSGADLTDVRERARHAADYLQGVITE